MAESVYTDRWTRSSRTSSSHRLQPVAAWGTAIPSLTSPVRKETGRSRDGWFLVRFIDTQHGRDGLRPLCVPFAPSLRAPFRGSRRKYPARARRRELVMNPSGEVGLDFRLLGPFEVASNGRLIEIGSPKQRALLAMLLVHRGRVVSFDALAEELWAGHPPASVVTTLSSLVSRLRRLLVAAGSEESGVFLRSSGSGYRLEIDARRVDAHRFDELVAQARQALAGDSPEVASRLLGQALALWRGPALADLADRSFARAEATRLDEARLEGIDELPEVDLPSGRTATAGEEVKTLGDGIMAAFSSTVDAIEAAVRIEQAVDRLNRRSERPPLEVRVGLSVGEATREEGDYFGTPAVAASRLCAAARGGQILVSEVTRLFAIGRGNHHFASLGPLELKGLPEPLATWELLWEPT